MCKKINNENIIWYIFYTLFIIFCIVMAVILVPGLNRLMIGGAFQLCCGIIILFLGAALIVSTIKQKIIGLLRISLIVTGVSALGIPIGILLHNLVFALLSLIFGQNFWQGGDEPVFFVLALIVFPIVFLISSIISIVVYFRQKLPRALK